MYIGWLTCISAAHRPLSLLSFHDSEIARRPPMPIALVVSSHCKKKGNGISKLNRHYMNQSFNRQQLYKFCKQGEFVEHGLTSIELSDKLEITNNAIIQDEFNFEITKVKEYYLTHDISNKLVLRKLNDNLKRLYKDEQANRRIIISQVKTLLDESCPFWVLKTDIKNFYESINREKLISKFKDDSMLSYQSMYLLNKVFDNPTLLSATGVPRGMNISSTLSEIYMRKFDKWIRRFKGVYYSARFVDDIIIFTNSLQSSLDLIANINPTLELFAEGLVINDLKTELFNGTTLKAHCKITGIPIRNSNSLEYLGYRFTKEKRAKINCLKVSIAEKKVRKIKTRIILALVDFVKYKNFKLLENRIKFLTGNYSIRKNSEGNDLRAGIYYNYLQVTDLKVFDELNRFYRKALFSKSHSFGNKLSVSLSPLQKDKLNKYCFKTGFNLKVYNSFSFEEMTAIISCW